MEPGDYYSDAFRLGKRQYSSEGKLLCLEKLLKNEVLVSNVNLGIKEIPLKKIIGTYSCLRSISFSRGFMPIMDANSEFKTKWTALCNHHLSEGISHPIKVYEYLNYYYVIEGNKRVSLLKYFNAFSILAEVIRILPKKDTNDKTSVIYYEFLDFYNKTKISSIWFSETGSFNKLSKLLDSYNPEGIKQDKYIFFEKNIYNIFRDSYLKLGGQKFSITTGDAYLEYANIYGISKPTNICELNIRLRELIKELNHFNEKTIDIKTVSKEETKRVLLIVSKLITHTKKLKVAFVYDGSIENSIWNYGHEIGRQYIEEKFHGQITTKYIQNISRAEQAYDYIKQLAKEGNNVIFTTSPVFRIATLKCALENKKVKFFNCSNDRPYEHMSCYSGRVYEPIFLLGIIAGALTKTNIIGYYAVNLSSEELCSINSFAIGTKIVNPYSKVKVFWTKENNSDEEVSNGEGELIAKECDVIFNRNIVLERATAEKYGAYYMLHSFDKNKEKKYLAGLALKWGTYYEKILNSILNNNFKTITGKFNVNSRLTNFWYGIDERVTDICYHEEEIPLTIQRLIEAMRKMIINKEFQIFTGPIIDNKGIMRIERGKVSSPEELFNMNWYVDNVESD